MNIKKTCPQCGDVFEGRSNQLYCGSICKQRSFHQGKALASNPMVQHSEPDNTTPTSKSRHSRAVASVSKTEVELEKIRLQGDEVMRRLENEEKERERQHDLEKQDRIHRHEIEITEQKRKMDERQWEADRQAQQDKLKASEPPGPVESISAANESNESNESMDDESTGTGWGLAVTTGVLGLLFLNLLLGKPKSGLPTGPVNKPSPKPTRKPGTGLDGLQLD